MFCTGCIVQIDGTSTLNQWRDLPWLVRFSPGMTATGPEMHESVSTPGSELRGTASMLSHVNSSMYRLHGGSAQPRRSYSRTTIMTEAGRQPWYDADGKPIAPYIVGVAGGSASGKTSIAKEVIRLLPNIPWVAIVSQDAFYRPLTPEQIKMAFNQNFDFDHPCAIDQELLVQCVKDLKESRAVQIPVYSFTQHQRTSESTYLYGHAVIVVEGIFVLQDPALRELLDLKIFVQTDPDIMLARRIRRDILDRGRSVEGVLDQYLRFVKPSFDTFVSPSARYADIIVPGLNNKVAIDVISQHIGKHLTRSRSLRLKMDADHTLSSYMSMRMPHHIFPLARVIVGTTAAGTHSHCVEHEPFNTSQPFVAVDQVLPLPPNVCVIKPKAQLQALLTMMHNVETPAGEYARACKRTGAFVVEEAMKLLPYRARSVETPQGEMHQGLELDVEYICGVSILRSGAMLEHPLRRALPALSLGSLLIQSSDSNYHPLLYSVELPSFVRDRQRAARTWVLLTDAQVGTGAAAFMAVRVLLDHGVPENQILILTLLSSARGGVWSLYHAFPRIVIITAGVDPGLQRFEWHAPLPDRAPSEDHYPKRKSSDASEDGHPQARVAFAIIPGCGQMGDRFWGT